MPRGSSTAGEKLKVRNAKIIADRKKRLANLQAKHKNASGPDKVRLARSITALKNQLGITPPKGPYTGPKIKHGDTRGHGRKKQYYNSSTKKFQKSNPITDSKKEALEKDRIKKNKEAEEKIAKIKKQKQQDKITGIKRFADIRGDNPKPKPVNNNSQQNQNPTTENKNKSSYTPLEDDNNAADRKEEANFRSSSSVEKAKDKADPLRKYRRGEGTGRKETRITKKLKKAGFTSDRLAKLRKKNAEFQAAKKGGKAAMKKYREKYPKRG